MATPKTKNPVKMGLFVWNDTSKDWEANEQIATEAKQDDIITELNVINSLTPAVYDYIALSYTGSNLTGVVFKTGGSGGTTISTLTLAYTGSVLDSVTKT